MTTTTVEMAQSLKLFRCVSPQPRERRTKASHRTQLQDKLLSRESMAAPTTRGTPRHLHPSCPPPNSAPQKGTLFGSGAFKVVIQVKEAIGVGSDPA